MSTCNSNIVVEWLRSLQLGQYADSFLDNGYDDLEICKQVGDPDLDAIGVFNPNHRQLLLQSVRSLREEGAASVYFTLEETAAATSQHSDNNSTRSSRPSSGRCSDKDVLAAGNSANQANNSSSPAGTTVTLNSNAGAAQVNDSPLSSSGSVTELGKYLDEYEEGKAELVRIPKLQLKLLLKDKLLHDGIRLSCQPYSTSTGDRGYLEGLASRYADRFNTHYQDVLEHLEELRRREWEELSPRMRVLPSAASTPGTPPFPGPQALLLTPVSAVASSSGTMGLPSSLSQQPIYTPGKYSPSSCLSDKEEDEIYGFGYGVYGKQMFQRQQQQQRVVLQAAAAAGSVAGQQHPPPPTAVPIYQSCLSPRSAYFYEFPPGEQSGCSSGTAKKKTTTFSRLLRGLKPHRKDKASSPTTRQRTPAGCNKSGAVTSPASRVGTPEGLCEAMVPTLMPSVADIRDYDHLRFLQMNGGGSGVATSFEETIQRLKMQEALKKKERFHKEQEEILRDIRHGLMQIGIEGGPSGGALNPFPGASDDTYMYDDDVRMAGLQGPPLPPLHWYDEPPYESDPEDFLMGGLQPPLGRPNAAIFQNGRVCFTLNLRSEPRGEGVISLRSAGDISLPRDGSWRGAPYAGMPPPSGAHSMTSRHAARHAAAAAAAAAAGSRQRHAMQANRESGDYAGSDVQSVSSRLSTVSVETSRSEHEVTPGTVNAAYMSSPGVSSLIQPQGKARAFRTLVSYKARSHSRASMSEDGLSPCSHSSDYEEDELQITTAPSATAAAIHARLDAESRSSGAATLVGRMRGLRQDVQRKISRLRTSQSGQANLGAETTASSTAAVTAVAMADPTSQSTSPAITAAPLQTHSSVESLPSGSGSSTQALVPAGSSHSLMSPDEGVPKSTPLPVIGKARALVDYNPSPYDKDALRFKKGDVIDVVAMNASGLWKGRLHNRVGIFKFINVELLTEARPGSAGGVRVNRGRYASRLRPSTHKRGRPKSVEELLHRMNMEAHISVFVLNGYEDLELFKELEEADLDFLGISHPEHRAKILTAVQLLHDYDSPESPDSEDEDEPESSTDGGHSSETSRGGHTSFQRRHFPRDSGCYASSSERLPRRGIDPTQRLESSPHHLTRASSDTADTPNNLDSTILEESGKKAAVSSPVRSTCSSPASVMARKISAQAAMASALAAASLSAAQARHQESEEYHPNIPVLEHADPPDPTPLNAIIATPTSAAGPRTPTFDFRAEYDKLRGKLEASLSRGSPIRIRKPEGGGEAIALRQLTSEMASARCFSEKSSDSGISSSSRSPPPPQNTNTSVATPQASNSAATSSPTRVFAAFGCGLDRKPGTPNMLTNIEKNMFQ